jgi:hypothetical protein
MKELKEEYIFAMKKASYLFTHPNHIVHKTIANSEKFALSALNESGAMLNDPSKFLLGRVVIAARGLSEFMFNANSEIHPVLVDVLAVFYQLIEKKDYFYTFKIPTTCTMEIFEEKSKLFGESMQSRLVQLWPRRISEIIKSQLSDSFNFKEDDFQKYSSSRLKPFMYLISTIMDGQILNLVTNGLINYLNMFGIDVHSTTEDKSVMFNDVNYVSYSTLYTIPKQFKPRSIITIYLSLELPGKSSIIDPNTSLEDIPLDSRNTIRLIPSPLEIKSKLLSLFTLPVDVTSHCIPTVESLILDIPDVSNTFVPTIECKSHQITVQGTQLLTQFIDGALPKINAVLEKYKRFEYLLHSNAAEFLTSKSPLDDFEVPVQKLKEAQIEMDGISSDMLEFPPFILDCVLIKKIFSQVANDSFRALGDLLSNRLLEKCLPLLEIYRPLSVSINLDPGIVTTWWRDLELAIKNGTRECESFGSQVLFIVTYLVCGCTRNLAVNVQTWNSSPRQCQSSLLGNIQMANHDENRFGKCKNTTRRI